MTKKELENATVVDLELVRGIVYESDGWYWDKRLVIRLFDQEFLYIDVGSVSGYIPCQKGVYNGVPKTLVGEGLERNVLDEYELIENILSWKEMTDILYVIRKIIRSGKESYAID